VPERGAPSPLNPALDAVYALLAEMLEPARPGDARMGEAMTIAAALAELGEDRSWASVWYAYGALHHDLSDEALERGRELLTRVERPAAARAAALMLLAEVEQQQATYAHEIASPARQRDLLAEAVALAPEWPMLHVRLARAYHDAGDDERARFHADETLSLLPAAQPRPEPFEDAISGRTLSREYITEELRELGLA
jgi:hypothetical protein